MEPRFDDDQTFSVLGAQSTFTSLPNYLFGKVTAYEIATLLALSFYGENSSPTHAELSALAGMSISSIQRSLQSLKDKNLVAWESAQNGITTSNSYRLLLGGWQPLGHTDRTLSHTDRTLGHTDRPCTEGAQRNGGVLGSGDASHLYISSSSNEEEGLEDKKDNINNINNIYNNTEKHTTTNKPSTQKKVLKIPDKLQPVRDLLITWWKSHKGGLKTQTSWNILLGEFDKILNDPNVSNDIEAISQILISAIDSSEKGKPWQSIRYQNWVEYNKEKWIKFKEAQTSKSKSPTYTGIVIPDYHNKV